MTEIKSFSDLTGNPNFYAELVALDEAVLKSAGAVYDSSAWTEDQFRYALPQKDQLSVAAFQDDIIAGFSIGYAFLPDWHHISRVAVHPTQTGKGIARQMLAAQLETMQTLAPALISVDTTRVNAGAFKLYTGFGFSPLEGPELERYVQIRHRDPVEYLGENATHFALIYRCEPNFNLTTR